MVAVSRGAANAGGASSPLLWAVIGLVTILGIVLRFHALDRATLWIDELTILSFAAPPKTPGGIVREIYEAELRGFTGQHMPMQYVLANLALRWAKTDSTESLARRARFPFALFGVLTIPLVFWAAGPALGRRAAAWSAFLVACSFFHVYQSRDATSYGPLLFFQTLALGGAARLLPLANIRLGVAGDWPAIAAFSIGMIGMFFTHLITWFFGATLGLLAALVLARGFVAPSAGHRRDGAWIVLCLLALTALPFLKFPLAAAGGAGITHDVREPLSLELAIYQLAAFGWGRGGGRLTTFLSVWAWGWWVLHRRGDRRLMWGLAGLIIIPSVIFFAVLMRDFFPRYLAVVFLPFTAVAGVALADLHERVNRLVTFEKLGSIVFAVSVPGAILLWHRAPYETLFTIKDKLMPFSIAREWILRNVPEGGLYMWRNGYFLREVPGGLPTPGRYAAFADHPNLGIPRAEFERRSMVARDTFRRFPEAVLITEPATSNFYYHLELWTWTEEFPRSERFYDPTLARLWRWGFSPHGYRIKEMTTFTARWRTREDIVRERGLRGEASAWPTGPGWRYLQTREGIVLAAPAAADARVAMTVPAEGRYVLRARGVAPSSGRLTFWRVEKDGWGRLGDGIVTPSDHWKSEWGPWELAPGDEISIQVGGERVPFLLIYDFEIARR